MKQGQGFSDSGGIKLSKYRVATGCSLGLHGVGFEEKSYGSTFENNTGVW
jgi:hypothetical protein